MISLFNVQLQKQLVKLQEYGLPKSSQTNRCIYFVFFPKTPPIGQGTHVSVMGLSKSSVALLLFGKIVGQIRLTRDVRNGNGIVSSRTILADEILADVEMTHLAIREASGPVHTTFVVVPDAGGLDRGGNIAGRGCL